MWTVCDFYIILLEQMFELKEIKVKVNIEVNVLAIDYNRIILNNF